MDGLIHITDLSWGRVSHPSEVVELDQKLNVVILDFDDEKKRIALGLKQLQPHPWDALNPDLKVGDHVKGRNFAGMAYAAPAEVGDVDETVHAAEVDEHTVGSDVLDSAFEHLSFFELADDFALLSFEFGFDESLVADNDVFEFFVDFNDFEFHGLAHEHVVVADGLDVDLRAGQECLDAEHVDNHAAFGAAFDEAFDDFVVGQSRVDAIPAACCARFLVGEEELAFFVLLVFDEHLYYVADFEVGVVAEFIHGDDTVALVADVHNGFTLVESDDGAFNHFVVFYGVEAFVVGAGEFFARLFTGGFAFFKGFPVEFFDGSVFKFCH